MLGWVMTVHAADESAGLIRDDIDLEATADLHP